jgi:hippurate hydrolase
MKLVHAAGALLFLTPLVGLGETTPQQLADAELPSLVALYKQLHAAPELSMQEEKSAAAMAKELRAVGCEVTEKVGKYEKPEFKGHGVVGVMKNGAGPTVMVRADIDGLPIPEETGLPYASKVIAKNTEGQEVPVMHGCGHDMHMAAFVGTARVLAKLRDRWSGTIVFVAQPAEEIGTGARAMLRDGLYTRWPKPDFALGLHDNAGMAAGTIAVTEGYTFANVDSVDVTVRGISGHGAYPHKTKDPIVLAAQMVQGWQTIASREVNPLESVVVTVGSIHGGLKHNIISEEAKMQLTVRTYKKEVRDQVLAAIARIAKGTAVAAGLPEDACRSCMCGRRNSRLRPTTIRS